MRLVAQSISCERSGRLVLAGLTFTVLASETLQVVGPNGAGKSSLLRLVAGLVRVSAGRLSLEGGEPEASIGEQTHYCGHLDAAKPALTVAENLDFWTAYLGGGGVAREDALERLSLGHLAETPAAFLSAGQKRRLSLARLLTVARPIWLLDEPTAALDVASQETLFALLAEHAAKGGLALVATHQTLGLPTRTLDLGRGA